MQGILCFTLSEICPYCYGNVVFRLRGRNRKKEKNKWECEDCKAKTFCHPGTVLPLGQIANKELGKFRIELHSIIDKLWKNTKERRSLYGHLSRRFKNGRPFHIGWLSLRSITRILSEIKRLPVGRYNNI